MPGAVDEAHSLGDVGEGSREEARDEASFGAQEILSELQEKLHELLPVLLERAVEPESLRQLSSVDDTEAPRVQLS